MVTVGDHSSNNAMLVNGFLGLPRLDAG